MNPDFAVDYTRGLATLTDRSLDEIIAAMRDELPDAWIERYKRMCSGPTNVFGITVDAFDYLFDHATEIVDDRDDRLVVAYGVSRAAEGKRNASRIRGDRGHFIAHAAGGGLDINLFHQDARLNRGWSPEGRIYRTMERYVAEHDGTFFFSRPIYSDATARPELIEFGILRPDVTLWVEVFDNLTSPTGRASAPRRGTGRP
jgi:hypothetical protein